jgi:quercetin dioxygenase-like cupin family protein
MTVPADTHKQPSTAIPADNPSRKLAIADPDNPDMRFIAVAGGVYTILLSGEETGGRYCLIEMQVPPGAGPPPHRHDFEEMFTILDGEIDLTFRGTMQKATAGVTVNIPANAPHAFKNNGGKPARMLCMCSPAGQEEFFMAVGQPVASRTAPAPKPSPEQQSEAMNKARALAPKFRTELLGP